ncbi:MAG: Abi family protein [Saccharofermentanales bacterium]
MINSNKPKLTIIEQIEHLESKGIKFNLISKDDATDYLNKNNNYFKLRSYRKSFLKHTTGESYDKYINLDFGQLKDLAIIDMRLRYALIHIALDVEHFSKIKLLKSIDSSSEDGYMIVEDYVISLSEKQKEILKNELERNRNNTFCGDIITSYDGKYPVWAFVEIIPFGSFI